jgi:hypothetical protein
MNDKRKWVTEMCSEVALWDGMDAALIGIAERCGQPRVAVYDRDKALSMLRKEMTPEEAEEYFEFNVAGASIGPLTPFILTKIPRNKQVRSIAQTIKDSSREVFRLREALAVIAEFRDEPYSADFAKDIIALSEQREQR